MGKILIICEKEMQMGDYVEALEPSAKSKTINRVNWYEGDQYVIASANGHILGLAEPEFYDLKFGTWKWDTLPIIPESFKHVVPPRHNKRFELLKSFLNQPFDFVINACDPAREGELIFRRIYNEAGSKLPIKRIWLSTLTKEAIQKGMKNLIEGSAKNNLYFAAHCRAIFDWELGINATRAMSLASGQTVRIGRVVTPTLAMLVKREKEILNFNKARYFQVKANFGDLYSGLYINEDSETNLPDKALAEGIVSQMNNQSGLVTEIKEETKRVPPPELMSLSELQKECNNIWGYTADFTLNIAQKLYEERKILSYPRTESRYLSTGIVPEIPKILGAISVIPSLGDAAKRLLQLPDYVNKTLTNKRYVDDSEVKDHYALIPTDKKPNLGVLSEEERNVYLFVVKRLLCIFFPYAEYRLVEVITTVNGLNFVSKGKEITQKGWKWVFPDKKDAEILPEGIVRGNTYPVTSSELLSKETQPQKRYTDATLLAALENPMVEKYSLGKRA